MGTFIALENMPYCQVLAFTESHSDLQRNHLFRMLLGFYFPKDVITKVSTCWWFKYH